jgi:hypothetical protein
MFVKELKTMLVEAVKKTFDGAYPVEKYRELWTGIEYPEEQSNYPGIWIDWQPTGQLQIAGIDHQEFVSHPEAIPPTFGKVKRWTFQGYATFTIVAMSSLDRDDLLDEMLTTLAFGDEDRARSKFRANIEDNPFLAVNFDFDQIGIGGEAASPGTPWGTEDILYEVTITMEVVGEFVSAGRMRPIVPLSEVVLYPYTDREGDPTASSPDPEPWS